VNLVGRSYGLRDRVQSLVTLGSPHQAIRGTALRRLVLEGVSHGGWFGERWYGSADVLALWVPWLAAGACTDP
jgi:hypothetical protein